MASSQVADIKIWMASATSGYATKADWVSRAILRPEATATSSFETSVYLSKLLL